MKELTLEKLNQLKAESDSAFAASVAPGMSPEDFGQGFGGDRMPSSADDEDESFDDSALSDDEGQDFDKYEDLNKRDLLSRSKDGGSIADVPENLVGKRDKNDRSKCYYAQFTLPSHLKPKTRYWIEAKRWRKIFFGKKEWDSPYFVVVRPPNSRKHKPSMLSRMGLGSDSKKASKTTSTEQPKETGSWFNRWFSSDEKESNMV